MKKVQFFLFVLGIVYSNFSFSQVTASDCDDHVNICSDDNFAIDPNGFGNVNELGDGFSTGLVSNPSTNPGVNGNMGCLMSGEMNSTWMVITVSSAGALEFSFGQDDPTGMNFDCYDWIMWPYDPATTCSAIQNDLLPPVACNWNGACEGFTGMANNLPAGADASNFEAAINVNPGDQFIVCFSNFSSVSTNVPLTFYQNPGSAGVSCSPIWVNDETICEGECTDLTANGGSNYTWSPTTGLTPTTGATVTACPPNAGTWNYVVTGDTPDGPAGDTATVIVLASTDPACGTTCNVNAGNDVTICIGDQTVLTASGTDTYSWSTGETNASITVSPTSTTEYIVIGNMNVGCSDTDTVVVTVIPLPLVDAGPDQTICAGEPVTVSGSGAVNYTWNNGIVDGLQFFPGGTITLICNGVDADGCSNTDTMEIVVNPVDDSTFSYNNNIYCITGTNPVLDLQGTPGGTFSSTPAGLVLDPATGAIDVANSSVGVYDVTYTTNGLCPTSMTNTVEIINSVQADFFIDDYCWNETDPSPTFVNGGMAGAFSSSSNDLVIDPVSGQIDLDASSPGIYVVTNLIDIPGCAIDQFQDSVEIFDLPDGIMSGGGTVCLGDVLPDIQVDLIGSGDWTFDYTKDGITNSVHTNISPYIIPGSEGVFELILITDNTTGCVDSILNQSASINIEPIPVVQPVQDIFACEGEQVQVPAFNSGVIGTTFNWTNTNGVDVGTGLNGTGDIGAFTGLNGTGGSITGDFEVTPTSPFGCVGDPVTFSITIRTIPTIDISVNYSPQCAPATAEFTNNNIQSSESSLWSFGDGSVSTMNGTVSHVYNAEGCYDLTLTVTDSIGCSNTVIMDDIVCVEPDPIANFLFDPSITDIADTEIQFQNLSEDATSFIWNFGDNSAGSTLENPMHTYPQEPSEYIITLVVTNDLGCSDTAYSKIVIRDVLLYYIPNAFTPDNDEFNQIFQPIFTSGYDPLDYTLQIFNRWGELLFVSNNPNAGWDGRYRGQLVQDGVYVWRVEFKETMTDVRHKKTGSVTILR